MKVSELIKTLEGIDPGASVVLVAQHNPGNHDDPGEGTGDVVYVAVTDIDDRDRVVALCNCVEDSKGRPVFDAPPQFKRFSIRTIDGTEAAIADLREQMCGDHTEDLRLKQQVDELNQWIDSMLNPKEKASDQTA
jgi:hypothetical protein